MVNEAETHREEDEKVKAKIAAKNSVEAYCFSLRETLEADYDRIEDEVSESEKTSVFDCVREILQWLGANQYEHKQRELEEYCKTIISKI